MSAQSGGDAERPILVDRMGDICYVTLNRPHKLNALSEDLLSAFDDAMDLIAADRGVSVVIFRGAGRAFSAGYDLTPGQYTPGKQADILDDDAKVAERVNRWFRVWDLPQATIAQVHGPCYAGGTQLASVCDMTVVSDDAVIGLPQLPLGGGFISPFWVHLVGPKRAKEMSFRAGSTIDPQTALDWGWVNRVVPAADLDVACYELAVEIAATPPGVIASKKRAINTMVEAGGFRSALKTVATTNAVLHFSPQTTATRQTITDRGLAGAIQHFREQIDARKAQADQIPPAGSGT
ncbi:enoyl-CoA hydratase/isomerase family protein [Aeromicrobium sp.]|uniref:enoyl-CoA hydratase/isomerase family protein n=1 Tax=Aeromicrobium sp. TaxID=1871063 RepID=UPI0025C1A701|nr:enoyl-CoA hydratase/isomerase family protein [Aeromicrobium sp.]MCK5890261.1 enoyl-CoA hydratase/isomerase family protein [Aeromicrobium sp.]